MLRLHVHYPHYGWHENAGYATALHRAALSYEASLTPRCRLHTKVDTGCGHKSLIFYADGAELPMTGSIRHWSAARLNAAQNDTHRRITAPFRYCSTRP